MLAEEKRELRRLILSGWVPDDVEDDALGLAWGSLLECIDKLHFYAATEALKVAKSPRFAMTVLHVLRGDVEDIEQWFKRLEYLQGCEDNKKTPKQRQTSPKKPGLNSLRA